MRCYGRLVGRHAAHRAGARADAAPVVVLAAAGDDGAGRHRAGAGRGPRARLRRARRRTAAPGAARATGARRRDPRRDRGGPAARRDRALGRRLDRLPQLPARVRVLCQARGRDRHGAVDAERVFATVCTIGGDDGWFYANVLWWIRGAIDWLLGGPSFRRTRRHPTELRVGDVVDSWRVIALEPGRRLTLLMEMKAPGAGVLEFVVQPQGTRRERLGDGLLASGRRVGTRVLVRAGPRARRSSSRASRARSCDARPLNRPARPCEGAAALHHSAGRLLGLGPAEAVTHRQRHVVHVVVVGVDAQAEHRRQRRRLRRRTPSRWSSASRTTT